MPSLRRPRRWPLALALFVALTIGHAGTAWARSGTFYDGDGNSIGTAYGGASVTTYWAAGGGMLGSLERRRGAIRIKDAPWEILMRASGICSSMSYANDRGGHIATIRFSSSSITMTDGNGNLLGSASRSGGRIVFRDASFHDLGSLEQHGSRVTFKGPDGTSFGRVSGSGPLELIIGPFGGFAPLEGPIQDFVAVFGPFGVLLSFADPPCD